MSLLQRSTCLAMLALAAATGAHAAELGDASVRSYSGQPLSADIELTELTTQELADLQVRLARPEVFEGANVKMNPALAGATISLQRRDGRRVLRVTTSGPVQAEVLHLYFLFVSGSRERVRGVTLWLSPDPNPAPAAALASASPAAAAADRAERPVERRGTVERPVNLVATVSPGKEATTGERALMGAVERAFAARGGKVALHEEKPNKPAASGQDVRKEALKHASSADDFRRAAKPAKPSEPAVAQAAPAPEHEEKHEPKAPQRSFLPSKAELAEAARATKASVEGGAQPSPAPRIAKAEDPAPPVKPAAGSQSDAAMLNKLAELEGKLKTLQTQLGMANAAGAARVTVPEPAQPVAPVSAPAKAADPMTVARAAAAQPVAADKPATVPAAGPETPAAAPAHPATEQASAVPAEPPKAMAEEKKAVKEEKKEVNKEAPPPEPKKEIKISRPKLLTFLFAGSLVLLGIFGVIVHFVRKAKLKRSPIVRQSWSRDEDDVPARIEPAVAPPRESQAA